MTFITLATELSGGRYTALTFPWQTLRYQHTRAITTRLYELTKITESGEKVQRFSGSTVSLIVTALRRVLKECWRLGLMTAEEYQRSQPLPKGRMLKVFNKKVPTRRAEHFLNLRGV